MIPVIQGSLTTSNYSGMESVQLINLPAGINSGELLLIMVMIDRDRAPPSGLSGYTNLNYFKGDPGGGLYYKIATGSETNPTATYTSGCNVTYVTARISNFDPAQAPSASGTTTGTSTAPNSNNIVLTWGPADALVFSFFSTFNNTGVTISSQPSTYTGPTPSSGVGSVAYKGLLNISSEDPGAFTISPSISWRAFTIAVKGAVASLARNYGSTIYG